MRNILLAAGVAGLVGIFTACGGDGNHAGVLPDGGSSSGGKNTVGGKNGTAGKNTATDGGAGGASAEQGIKVVISSPTAATDPNTDEIITDERVTVVCSVTANDESVKVDGSSVLLEVLDADGKAVVGQDNNAVTSVGKPTGNPDEYSGDFTTTVIASGVVSFRCSASSVDKETSGETMISTFVDHGPTIAPIQPEPDSAHALEGILPVEFRVTSTPLTKDDDGANVTAVTLQVAGVAIDPPLLTQDAKDSTLYRAEIDFTDANLFKEPPPEHTSIHIEALNSRTPSVVTAVADYPIVVDGKGPAIAYTKPKDNAAVHGETVIEFTAADTGAGIDVDTLEISVTGMPSSKFDVTKTNIWTRQTNTFSFRFDTTSLVNVDSQITVSIRAEDLAGNLTDGVTLFIYKDDMPPLIDLDPLMARGRDSQKHCSEAFDPLGAALNDGVTTDVKFNLFRSLIYDDTNRGSGQSVYYFSGTDQSSARLYVQPDSTKPFLIDTNSDGICDSLAREDFVYKSLTAIKKSGALQYSLTDGAVAPVPTATCTASAPVAAPKPLCMEASDMTVVVQHDVETNGDEPCIYGVGALMGFECTGSKFDLGLLTTKVVGNQVESLSPDGWICLAARASDRLNNTGISRPLRICYDDPDVPGAPSCVNGGPPPSCTTACTPPPRFPAHIYRF